MPLDREQVSQESRAAAVASGGIVNYEWKVGQNRGRLLPPWAGSGKLAVMRYKHFALPTSPKMVYCYEKSHPGTGFHCPLCIEIAEARKRGLDPNRQDCDCHPMVNWVDRMADPMNALSLLELRMKAYNQLLNVYLSTGCDLTSLDLGFDVIITHDPNSRSAKYDAQVVPGAPQPLHPDPSISNMWIQKSPDLRQFIKMPDWQTPDGQRLWQQLCTVAQDLKRMYNAGTQVMVPGMSASVPPGFVPQAPPPAPPPQAPAWTPPPPVQQAPAPPPIQPQYAPQAPPMPPPPWASQPPAQPQYAPPASPIPPPPPPQYVPPVAPPPAQPQYAPQASPPLAMYQPPMPAPPAPPVQPQYVPPPAPPVQPQYVPPTAASAGPSMVNSAADARPGCFGLSYKDTSVVYGNVAGGWRDTAEDPVRSMRCSACPHELPCKDASVRVHRADYPEVPASEIPL